jgi:hypothetical protein
MIIDKMINMYKNNIISIEKPTYFMDDCGKIHPWYNRELKDVRVKYKTIVDTYYQNTNSFDKAERKHKSLEPIFEKTLKVWSVYLGKGVIIINFNDYLNTNLSKAEIVIGFDISITGDVNIDEDFVYLLRDLVENMDKYRMLDELSK